MDHFSYKQGQLYCEDVALKDIAATHGTPAFVYSRATIERHYRAFDEAFGDQPHQICYAVKANSNIAILNLLARLGSGFDIVSGGELERVLRAGADAKKVIFSGVGKSVAEIEAALRAGINDDRRTGIDERTRGWDFACPRPSGGWRPWARASNRRSGAGEAEPPGRAEL